MSESVVELKNVSKWYPSDPERRVIDGIDLRIAPGEGFAIVGPSGCGKSTLLNLLGTLDSPSEGEILVDGISLEGQSEAALAGIRSRKIGFIFQLHHLLPQCSALENVLVPTLALRGKTDPGDPTERARELFRAVGLEDKMNSHPAQLSGGERQRVAVIRSLINRPALLLADEPTGALDEENAANLVDLLVTLNRSEGLALVMVTHDSSLAARVGEVRTLRSGKLESLA